MKRYASREQPCWLCICNLKRRYTLLLRAEVRSFKEKSASLTLQRMVTISPCGLQNLTSPSPYYVPWLKIVNWRPDCSKSKSYLPIKYNKSTGNISKSERLFYIAWSAFFIEGKAFRISQQAMNSFSAFACLPDTAQLLICL